MTGTPSLKALARKVLERDTQRDKGRDSSPSSVPLAKSVVRGTGGTPALRSQEITPTQAPAIPVPGPGAQAQLWRDWYEERVAIREYVGEYPRAMAEALAYGEAVNRWHLLHRQRTDPALCAGCGELLSGVEALKLPDDVRIHVDDDWQCLRVYGRRWKAEAIKGLAELGMKL